MSVTSWQACFCIAVSTHVSGFSDHYSVVKAFIRARECCSWHYWIWLEQKWGGFCFMGDMPYVNVHLVLLFALVGCRVL